MRLGAVNRERYQGFFCTGDALYFSILDSGQRNRTKDNRGRLMFRWTSGATREDTNEYM